MPKNIVVFSDGTGQRGGQFFDESRTNIYKLFRATRCGPDSCIDPERQLTYYDAGLGTVPRVGLKGYWLFRWVYNLVSQATGLGLTANIVDCYAAIIKMWEPGDRIFLFGFSRGAYTVRCLAAVLTFCGVPSAENIKLDERSVRRIARYAVTKVYQHVSSRKDEKYLPQRHALARQFRERFGSGDDEGSNASAYFIGVFDTVAALASYPALALTLGLALVALLFSSWVLSYIAISFEFWLLSLTIVCLLIGVASYLWTHVKFAIGLPGYSFWQTLHLTKMKMQFYDKRLDPKVGYARHALAIDEHRRDFDRVEWGQPGEWRNTGEGNPPWFKQVWFAGNHSDIGGGYPENESRLSDIALKWMVEEATAVPDGILIDYSVLRLFPSHRGMLHDECQIGVFRYARMTKRGIKDQSTLHPSVIARMKEQAVPAFSRIEPYRPEELRTHVALAAFYSTADPQLAAGQSQMTGEGRSSDSILPKGPDDLIG